MTQHTEIDTPTIAIPDRARIDLPACLLGHAKLSAEAKIVWLAGRWLAESTDNFVSTEQIESFCGIGRRVRQRAMSELATCGLAMLTRKGGKKFATFWRFCPFDDRTVDPTEMRARAGLPTIATATRHLLKDGKHAGLLTHSEVAHVTRKVRASSVTLKPENVDEIDDSSTDTKPHSANARSTRSSTDTKRVDQAYDLVACPMSSTLNKELPDDPAGRGNRHALIVKAWCDAFVAAQGVAYHFNGGRDGRAAKALAAMPYPVETFAAMFRAGFEHAGKRTKDFYLSKCNGSLQYFQCYWNQIVVALGDQARSILGGATQGITQNSMEQFAKTVGATPGGVRVLTPNRKKTDE